MKVLQILENDNIFDKRYISENIFYEKEIKKAIKELKELELKFDILTINYKCLKEQLTDECDLIKTNKEHFCFLKQNERDFIVERFKSRFQLK